MEKVESFRYLRRIPIQDSEDVRAVQNKIKKAWGIWVQVGQVLQTDNTPPNVSTKFYKAVVQSVLLYGSKTWNLTTTALVRLEVFSSEPHSLWLRNTSLKEDQITCGSTRPPATCSRSVGCTPLHIILTSDGRQFSIRCRDRPIHAVCTAGEQRRGSGRRQWWWEKKILGRVDGRHSERPPKRRCRFILECGENNCAPHRGRLRRPLKATALTA